MTGRSHAPAVRHSGPEEGSHVTFTVMRFVAPSRDFLAETLLAAGPDAPTLCEGWRTRHLLAHLHLRETSPRRALGLVVKALAPATEKAVQELAESLDHDGFVRL